LSFFALAKLEFGPGLDGMLKLYRLVGALGSVGLELLAADDRGRWYSSLSLFFCRERKWCFFSFSLPRSSRLSMGLMVAEDELLRLYREGLFESTRLLVLKLWRCSAESAEPILPGLGRGFSLVSPLVLILLGREKSLTLDFSDFSGLSSCEGGNDGGWGS
jgi:hypothetical protein